MMVLTPKDRIGKDVQSLIHAYRISMRTGSFDCPGTLGALGWIDFCGCFFGGSVFGCVWGSSLTF